MTNSNIQKKESCCANCGTLESCYALSECPNCGYIGAKMTIATWKQGVSNG